MLICRFSNIYLSALVLSVPRSAFYAGRQSIAGMLVRASLKIHEAKSHRRVLVMVLVLVSWFFGDVSLGRFSYGVCIIICRCRVAVERSSRPIQSIHLCVDMTMLLPRTEGKLS